MPDKCVYDPNRDCPGLNRANEVAGDVKALNNRMDEFQQRVSNTNNNFGGRIGTLEAREAVRDEQYKHVQEKLLDITRDMTDFQRENKNSISELRREHKESMEELRKGNKEILNIVTPLKHDMDDLKHLEDDVKKLKEKPAKTWEYIKERGLGWAVGVALAIIAIALGLGNYL